ncbi:hypothetical protein [Nocardia sp. NPDC059228]|uniref:hypothetical protein n=1 Tax=Nocardia sp. NPDC059228 TaxID=3346777 RepID=UPI0036BEB71D
MAQQLDLCLEDRARDLVYPPPNSWRARLSRRPTLVLWSSSLVGVDLAHIYGGVHTHDLLADRLTDATILQLVRGVIIFYLCAFPLSVLVYVHVA